MPAVIDTTDVGKLTAEFMDQIEADYGSDASIGTVAIVVEVDVPDDGPGATQICYRCSDGRRWLQAGLFRKAMQAADRGADRGGD